MSSSENIPNYISFFKIIWKHRKLFFISNCVILILISIIAFTLPKWYEGRVLILIEDDQQNSLISSFLEKNIPFGLVGSQFNLVDQYIHLLETRTILDRIDSLYDLKKEYNIKYREHLYKAILQNATFINNGDNTITIKFLYKQNPEKAAMIANSFYFQLEKLVKYLSSTRIQKVRQFLENSYNVTLKQLSEAELKFSHFQSLNQLYILDDQTKAMIETISELEKRKIELEIQKKYLETYMGDNYSEIDAINEKIETIYSKINSLKFEKSELGIPLSNLPGKGIEYLRLLREVKIREKILEFIIPQLENARLEEQKKSVGLQIIDLARPPDYKAKPKRLSIIFITCFIFLSFSIFFIFLIESIKRRKQDLKSIFQKNTK